MKIPIGLFAVLGKFGYNLYCYIYKGPKIDLSLEVVESAVDYLGESSQNPNDRSISILEGIGVYDFTNTFKLVFKNNSANPAYNIKIIQGKELFHKILPLPQNLSLLPNEKHEIECQIVERGLHLKSSEQGKYVGGPQYAKNKDLIISYQNESRSVFYTCFKISSLEAINSYSLKQNK